MESISIKEARKHLSDLVTAAENGESIIITRRGKQVTKLDPINAGDRKGLPELSDFRASIKIKGQPLSSAIIEQRKKERY